MTEFRSHAEVQEVSTKTRDQKTLLGQLWYILNTDQIQQKPRVLVQELAALTSCAPDEIIAALNKIGVAVIEGGFENTGDKQASILSSLEPYKKDLSEETAYKKVANFENDGEREQFILDLLRNDPGLLANKIGALGAGKRKIRPFLEAMAKKGLVIIDKENGWHVVENNEAGQ